jgi:hypothetical protein
MRIAMLASASAIALFATFGSVSAADQITPKKFSTLNGVKAVPMSSGELSAVKGMDHHFTIRTPGNSPNVTLTGLLDPPSADAAIPLANGARIETNHHQADTDEGNFVTLEGLNGTFSPSYRGLRLHACTNAVIGATSGCP